MSSPKSEISGAVIGCLGLVVAAVITTVGAILIAQWNRSSNTNRNIEATIPTSQININELNTSTTSPSPPADAKTNNSTAPSSTPKDDAPKPASSGFIANSKDGWKHLFNVNQWRITEVQPEEKSTRFRIEIKNTEGQMEEPFFSFNTSPLVVIDERGGFYKMLSSSAAPDGVKEIGDMWYLQAQRVITVTLIFAPLAKGSTSGHIQYRDNNQAVPAEFSFMQ
jgi:hypothetical protein